MNDLERAVIEAARECAAWSISPKLAAAVQALDQHEQERVVIEVAQKIFAAQPTRFLVSFAHSGPRGSGFGMLYHDRERGGMPNSEDIQEMCDDASRAFGTRPEDVVVLSISPVSPDGGQFS